MKKMSYALVFLSGFSALLHGMESGSAKEEISGLVGVLPEIKLPIFSYAAGATITEQVKTVLALKRVCKDFNGFLHGFTTLRGVFCGCKTELEREAESLFSFLLSANNFQERDKKIAQAVLVSARNLTQQGEIPQYEYDALLQVFLHLKSYLHSKSTQGTFSRLVGLAFPRDIVAELFQKNPPIALLFDLAPFIDTPDQGFAFLVACDEQVGLKSQYQAEILMKLKVGSLFWPLIFAPLRGLPVHVIRETVTDMYTRFSRGYFNEEQQPIYVSIVMNVFSASWKYQAILFCRGFIRDIG